MRIQFSFTIKVERAPKDEPERRDVDIAGTQTERSSEYEEPYEDKRHRRAGF